MSWSELSILPLDKRLVRLRGFTSPASATLLPLHFTQRLYISPDFAIAIPLKSDLAQISDKTDNLVSSLKVDVAASTYYASDFDMYSIRINVTEKSNCSY